MSEQSVQALFRSEVNAELIHRGKVRDVYDVGSDHLLMVTSDRVSAFDVVMDRPVPRKGELLTLLTSWWLKSLEALGIEHHLISVDPDEIITAHPALAETRSQWARRGMLVRRTKPVMVECVIRGFLSGSAWKEYRVHGTLAGEPLPEGLQESEQLPAPLFSPATKAVEGHDENITPGEVRNMLGAELADELERLSQAIYRHGRETCAPKGIILADTKFEFGHDADGRLLLIDEVLTPDSSRFWPVDHYAIGRGQPSLDKQPLRDWLDTLSDWNKEPPPPPLPDSVVEESTRRYLEIFRRLTGVELTDFTTASEPSVTPSGGGESEAGASAG